MSATQTKARGARALRVICWAAALLLPLAILAHVVSRQATDYLLEIPVECEHPVSADLLVDRGGGFNSYDYSMALIEPGNGFQPARLQLPRGRVVGLIFRIRGTPAGRIVIGQPRVRCAADVALGLPFQGRSLRLGGILPLAPNATCRLVAENRLEIVALGGSEERKPGCAIDLAGPPLALNWNAAAFARNFGVAALLYLGGLGLVLGNRRRIDGWFVASDFSNRLCAPAPSPGLPASGRERLAVAAMLVGSAILQINAVVHGGTMGQDWVNNYSLSRQLLTDPAAAFHWSTTNPPGYYLVASLLMRAGGPQWAEQLIGVNNLLLNVVALGLLYRLAVRFIGSPAWRLGLMAFVTFLPVRLIHSVVLAGDALTLLPILLLACLLIRLLERPSAGLALGVSLTLVVGVLIKFTFMSALVATVLVIAQGYRRGIFHARQAVLLGLLAVLPPTLLTVAQVGRHETFGETMIGHPLPLPNEFPLSSLLFLRPCDPLILDAPYYDATSGLPPEVRDSTMSLHYELLTQGRYSYPALLHLAVFTDLMNVFQINRWHTLNRWAYQPVDLHFGDRQAGPNSLMVIAVTTAVPMTLICVGSIALLALGYGWRGAFQPTRSRADVEVILLLAVGWFTNIVGFLPFVGRAYVLGFWMPRLILPSLVLFPLLTSFVLDRLVSGSAGRSAARVALICLLLQSALHASFLWSTEALY